jgi:hypothetical protein
MASGTEWAMQDKFGDLLDEMTGVREMRLETRVERLERIVQTLLPALVEETKPSPEEEDDRLG